MPWWSYEWYRPSKPRRAKHGIRAQSRSGDFGQNWWSKRWLSALDSYGWSVRLQRGKAYARKGQVVDYIIKKGVINAKVQGSMPKPYDVVIKMKVISDEKWENIVRKMCSQAIFSAKLLSGEMPENIEKVFKGAGVGLFPRYSRDIKADCSCPDWENPCKHVAAVFYILAEEFDRNPFMIFELRGRDKGSLLTELRDYRMEGFDTLSYKGEGKKSEALNKRTKKKKLEAKTRDIIKRLDGAPQNFWRLRGIGGFNISIERPPVEMSVLKRLGKPNFWKIKEDFMQEMRGVYTLFSEVSVQISYCDNPDGEANKPKNKF